jgi:hypothetical protein
LVNFAAAQPAGCTITRQKNKQLWAEAEVMHLQIRYSCLIWLVPNDLIMEWHTRLNLVIVVLHDILHQARVIVFYFPAMCHSLATATPWVKKPNLLVSLHPNVGFHNLRRWWSKWPQQLAAMLAAGLVCLFKCREMWCTPQMPILFRKIQWQPASGFWECHV